MNRAERRRAVRSKPESGVHRFTPEQAALLGRRPAGAGFGLPSGVGWDSSGRAVPMADPDPPPRYELTDAGGEKKPDGIVIVTEDELDPATSVWHGQFVIDSNIPNGLAFNFVDVEGHAWGGEESLEAAYQLVLEFLASDRQYMSMRSPIDGRVNLLTRAAAERILVVQQAKSRMVNRPVQARHGTQLIAATPDVLASLRG